MQSVDDRSRKTAGTALAQAYRRFRAEARDIVLEEHRDEFERVCPDWAPPHRTRSLLSLMEGPSRVYDEARIMLGTLAGFLDGYVRETQINLEAEAYAAAKLKAERTVGFHTD